MIGIVVASPVKLESDVRVDANGEIIVQHVDGLQSGRSKKNSKLDY